MQEEQAQMRLQSSSPETNAQPTANVRKRAPNSRVLQLTDLLGDDGRVAIEHDGALYELRLTRNNKLILTK